MGIFDWFRAKPEDDPEKIKKIVNDLDQYRRLNIPAQAAAGSIGHGNRFLRTISRGRASIGGKPGKFAAESEIFNVAERIAARGMREGKSEDEIFADIENEGGKQFKKKGFNARDWFSGEEIIALANKGIESAKEQVGYYEKEMGGRYVGQAVRKGEQLAGNISYGVRKTPLVGGLFFGKVPTGNRPLEKLDPNVRSAINKGRMELQKKARQIYDQGFKPRVEEYAKESQKISKELMAKMNELKAAKEKLQSIMDQSTRMPPTDKESGEASGGIGLS